MEWGQRRQSGRIFHRRSSSRSVAVSVVEDGGGGEENDTEQIISTSCNHDDDEHEETIQLPQSTHCLLFTENICSLPFAVALAVAFISMSCLILALFDNITLFDNEFQSIPANIPPEVRAAQYFSILIALAMEEEIPTALYLLRMIDRSAVEDKLKGSYSRFVISCLCRLLIGAAFLLNVFLVLAQSEHGEYLCIYAMLILYYNMHIMQYIAFAILLCIYICISYITYMLFIVLSVKYVLRHASS